MINLLLWLWQLPQNLLGLILLLIYRYRYLWLEDRGRLYFVCVDFPSGISLGRYIILKREDSSNTYNHEFGHSIQSRYLGPLYLIVIGLPSLLGNIWDRLFHRGWSWREREWWYYHQPWESWADRLGGVNRF